jgi:broad specificity phosphatase PhoE
MERVPRRLWLVRHGETEWARTGRHTSRTDVPLTDLGRQQARALGSELRNVAFGVVLSSPMQRGLETARLAGFADRVETTDDLREWDYGADEGLTTPEIREGRPGWSVWIDGPSGGETIAAVAERADRLIRRTLASEGDVLLFGHAHALRVLTARWLDQPPGEGRHYELGTGTISVLGWERETPTIERWNVSPRRSTGRAGSRAPAGPRSAGRFHRSSRTR